MPVKIVENGRHPRRSFKPSMRKSPYFVSLAFLLAATTLTILNIYVADLIHVIARKPGPLVVETKYGLYRRCTRKTPIPNSTFLAPSFPLSDEYLLTSLPSMPEIGPVDGEGNDWVCEEFPTRSECAEFGEKF
ncbi:MAG: hypothetical protein TREMPRED_004035, partial [Tremellales sp. Tagirdzhanova-0007]